jgi:hypothetical protein
MENKNINIGWRNSYYLGWFAIIVGLGLTVVSYFNLCSTECLEAHNYRYFGMPFELVGFAFFGAMIILHLLSPFYRWATGLEGLMVAGALGTELMFILIQKFKIGTWCPICLSIAVSIVFIAIFLSFQTYYKHRTYYQGQGRLTMSTMVKTVLSTLAFSLGLFMAAIGVFKPEKSFATGSDTLGDPIFGNRDSKVEVYIVTDWFCPACKRMEPYLDTMYPDILPKASLIFVDKPIHPESMNFTPYNLSFMVRNKDKYIEIRKALSDLASKTKTPSQDEIEKSIKHLGIKYEPLNYSDVDSGVRFFQGIANTFDVSVTPTVVVANRKNLKAKKFTGSDITRKNIMDTIDELAK